jgi:hypothetical protein
MRNRAFCVSPRDRAERQWSRTWPRFGDTSAFRGLSHLLRWNGAEGCRVLGTVEGAQGTPQFCERRCDCRSTFTSIVCMEEIQILSESQWNEQVLDGFRLTRVDHFQRLGHYITACIKSSPWIHDGCSAAGTQHACRATQSITFRTPHLHAVVCFFLGGSTRLAARCHWSPTLSR